MDNTIILLPSYGGLFGQHVISLSNISCERKFVFGAPIDQARCFLLHEAMEDPTKEIFVFIDADVSFIPEDLERLVADCSRTREIVSGCYVLKNEYTNRIVCCIDETAEITRQDGLIPCTKIGMGFAAIHREALEKINKTVPKCNLPRANGKTMLHPLFIPMIREGDYLGEDYAFCVRAKEAGVNIWLDSNILLTHWGYKGYQLRKD